MSRYIKTTSGILFKFSNQFIQMMFQDGSSIITDIFNQSNILYVNKDQK